MRDARPARRPARRRRACRRSRSARGCRARGAGRALWRRVGPDDAAGPGDRARRSSTRPAGGSACRRWTDVHGGISRAARARRRRSRSSSTRARRTRRRTSSGRCCGSRRSARSSCPPGDDAARARRAVDVAGPRADGCCARRWRAWPTCRSACWRTWNRREPPDRRSRCPPTRGWSSGSPTRRRCPRCDVVVCHAGHGTLVRALAQRLRGRRVPGRGRHERERRAGRLGRRRRAAAAALHDARARSASRSSARSPTTRCARASRELAAWHAANDPAARGRGPGRGVRARIRPAIRTSVRIMERAWLRIATGRGPVVRGDRAGGRQASVDGRLLGEQARPELRARGSARGAGRDRALASGGRDSLPDLDPRHGRRAWTAARRPFVTGSSTTA